MFKRFFLIFIFLFSCLFFLSHSVSAKENKVILYFFWSKSCPHCAKEKVFLENLSLKYPNLTVKDLQVGINPENWDLLKKVCKKLNFNTPGLVPFTVIGDQYIVGYLNDETTGSQIEETINCVLENGCQDLVAPLINSKPKPKTQPQQSVSIPETLDLPLIGKIKTKNLSLPTLSITLGLLDGFNPCAMWTLLFLISLLLGMQDRKRMWALGSAFIITSAFVYFLIMAAWLNLFLLLGFITWVRIAIGLVAIGAGIYNLRDYYINKEGGCAAAGDEKRQKIFAKIKDITQKKQFLLALIGIILLAFAVNVVELVCSAGLPAIFTQVLTLSNLPTWQYYSYLLLYILFFMLDDLIIFFIAMITLKAIGIESKYARISRLIGGILITIIGLLLLFKPELLMFA